jgi:hypothetical protein
VVPLSINRFGGRNDVQKQKGEGEKPSSVVFAFMGCKIVEHVSKGGLRAPGVKYDVERYVNAGPHYFSRKCSRWGHVEMKYRALNMVA